MISSCSALPAKGFLLLEGHVEEAAQRRAAQDTLPTAELPAGTLPVPTAGTGTWAPQGQSCPTQGPLSPTANNSLCSSRPNSKCHFHTNFQAWAQVFVFQGTLQKAFAFCTDGDSQDLENNPAELMRLDFPPPWNYYYIWDFSEYKRLQLKLGTTKAEVNFH